MTAGPAIEKPADLTGTASDRVPEILATGDGGIGNLFVSMSERHPQGQDADYLRWHSLDHRPEQHRLISLRASMRVVSTPDCRAVRAVSDSRYDAVDHLVVYFFGDLGGLIGFEHLAAALRTAGRSPFVLTPVQRGVYQVAERVAAPAAKLGADVLPWMPVTGLYVLVERGTTSCADLAEVEGVAGVWCGKAMDHAFSSVEQDTSISLCFLSDDPIATAERLRPVLQRRWQLEPALPLLAAPFHSVLPYQWGRYLP